MRAIYLLGLVFFISCSNKNRVSDEIVVHKPDQIEYYRLAVSDKELGAIFRKENMSSKERRLAEILYHNAPETLADSSFIADMDDAPYYMKLSVDKKQNNKILDCFATHQAVFAARFEPPAAKLCAPTYRDILVFRKESKLMGFAKVCFECKKIHTVGMYPKDEEVEVDYDGLNILLRGNSGS